MDKSMKKKDNRGMSLVEIIIVIALMTVVASGIGFGLNLISKKPVQECAKKVEIALNQNRTNSMGKIEAYLKFYISSDRVAVREYTQSARESAASPGTDAVIGAADVKLRFVYKDAAGNEVSEVLGEDVTEKEVRFKRDSGSVKETPEGLILDRIEVYKGAGNVMTVSIEKLTGKVTVQ